MVGAIAGEVIGKYRAICVNIATPHSNRRDLTVDSENIHDVIVDLLF